MTYLKIIYKVDILLSTVLQCTLGYTCLFQFWFPQCVCPAVGLLGHMAVLLAIFREMQIKTTMRYHFTPVRMSAIQKIFSTWLLLFYFQGEVMTTLTTDCIQFTIQSLRSVQLCKPMDCSTPGLPVHHQLLEFTQTLVH